MTPVVKTEIKVEKVKSKGMQVMQPFIVFIILVTIILHG